MMDEMVEFLFHGPDEWEVVVLSRQWWDHVLEDLPEGITTEFIDEEAKPLLIRHGTWDDDFEVSVAKDEDDGHAVKIEWDKGDPKYGYVSGEEFFFIESTRPEVSVYCIDCDFSRTDLGFLHTVCVDDINRDSHAYRAFHELREARDSRQRRSQDPDETLFEVRDILTLTPRRVAERVYWTHGMDETFWTTDEGTNKPLCPVCTSPLECTVNEMLPF